MTTKNHQPTAYCLYVPATFIFIQDSSSVHDRPYLNTSGPTTLSPATQIFYLCTDMAWVLCSQLHASSYLALWMAIALESNCQPCFFVIISRDMMPTHLPLGSVCLDHLGVQRMTVEAHDGGKCSSNMVRYQYLFPQVSLHHSEKMKSKTYASLVSGISAPHSGLGFFIISSVTCISAWSLSASIQP
jgi:hypothetical protein